MATVLVLITLNQGAFIKQKDLFFFHHIPYTTVHFIHFTLTLYHPISITLAFHLLLLLCFLLYYNFHFYIKLECIIIIERTINSSEKAMAAVISALQLALRDVYESGIHI